MFRLLAVVLILLITMDTRSKFEYDLRLKRPIDEFFWACADVCPARENVDIEIRLVPAAVVEKVIPKAVAVCIVKDRNLIYPHRLILVADTLTTYISMRSVIIHEMEHCLFDIGHSKPDSISFMIEYMNEDVWYARNWQELWTNDLKNMKLHKPVY